MTQQLAVPPFQPLKPRRSMSDIHNDRQTFACKNCNTTIASGSCLVSKGFRGYSGKAALFTEASNINLSPPSIMLMDTGAHTIQELSCASCSANIGWKFVRAHESPEKWKEGHCLLELALLQEGWAPLEHEGETEPQLHMAVANLSLGHRRTATDPHALRGRPHGPRSLTPSLRNRDRTLSVLSQAA